MASPTGTPTLNSSTVFRLSGPVLGATGYCVATSIAWRKIMAEGFLWRNGCLHVTASVLARPIFFRRVIGLTCSPSCVRGPKGERLEEAWRCHACDAGFRRDLPIFIVDA